MKKLLLLISTLPLMAFGQTFPNADSIMSQLTRVNDHWQQTHPLLGADKWPFAPYTNNSPFWDNAAYHTGNMEAFRLTQNARWLTYSKQWAEAAHWMGAVGNDPKRWEYHYGETPNHVLFGDWQICFQTYADLYTLSPDSLKIKRAREVMEYEMSTTNNDYWWWADGLYMVMPVMTRLYKITGNNQYLTKLYEYWSFAKELMYDSEDHLFYRDAKYIYPQHKTAHDKKDFWSRGNGWVLAGLARVLQDLPEDFCARDEFAQTFTQMAEAVRACQQNEGWWTRSLLDAEQAPGPETSGTAFFTYGIAWGINNGFLPRETFLPVVLRSWDYLSTIALQQNGIIGYVQPIGERAIPGQMIDAQSTANFGVGAFLLAASEMYRLVTAQPLTYVGMGYSGTSVNTPIFRASSVCSFKDIQFVAYYDADGFLTIGKRDISQGFSNPFEVKKTDYRANVLDAHNSISMAVDGRGYLHVSFGQHNAPLTYCRSTQPFSLELGDLERMIGNGESNVTYPEFYRLPNGNLIFAYRNGESGNGDLVLNQYNVRSKHWKRLHNALISGEGSRNAYWQMCVDARGTIHLSWVWRESWLVETNHDMCYACSKDGGRTWRKTDNQKYGLPITASNAEYACHIPQNSELINQTSMSTDEHGNPYIVTYWADSTCHIPNYRVIWYNGKSWNTSPISNRQMRFSLSGGGTKMIPIARPRILIQGSSAMVFVRDAERGSRVSVWETDDITQANWTCRDLTAISVHAWEPSLDMDLWQSSHQICLFVQNTYQGDGEKAIKTPPTPVFVLNSL